MTTTELVPRKTVAQIVMDRNAAMEAYEAAHDALVTASDAIEDARKKGHSVAPRVNQIGVFIEKERDTFLDGLKVADKETFMDNARRITDVGVWSNIMELTQMSSIMDKKAKDEFRDTLKKDPPAVTEDNIFATVQELALQSGEIFKRGIAECFSNLDRRFKSHDGFKIGSRIIIDRMMDDSGRFSYYSNKKEVLTDIERTFVILDGQDYNDFTQSDRAIENLHTQKRRCQDKTKLFDIPEYGGIVHAIEHSRSGKWSPEQSEVDSKYFTVRIFKNGNAHVWFKDDNLVRRVNKLLSEYYGEVIGDMRQAEETEEDIFGCRKMTTAKDFGFFVTPDNPAEEIIAQAYVQEGSGKPKLKVLEPSAGTGNLARRCAEKGHIVDCIEIQPQHADALKASGLYNDVACMDFLLAKPEPIYDRAVMNPPFDLERDIDHVTHAWGFLKDDGFLIAIMSAGVRYRETKKAVAFRKFVERNGGKFYDLPAGSFKESGTNVNTCYVRIWKNGHKINW